MERGPLGAGALRHERSYMVKWLNKLHRYMALERIQKFYSRLAVWRAERGVYAASVFTGEGALKRAEARAPGTATVVEKTV